MADQENYDNNEELMNEQEFMGDNNGDSNNQDDDHNGTNGGAENAGRDDDRWATLARISAPRFDWQEKTINAHPRVFPTSFWFWKLFFDTMDIALATFSQKICTQIRHHSVLN